MPKGVSKEKNELISGKGCYRWLLDRDDTKKKLKICNQLLDSVLKTRAGARRDKYVLDLRNTLKKLCIFSTDLIETKAKLQDVKADYSRESRKRADLQDNLIEANYKNNELSEFQARFEQARENTLKSEQDYGQLLAENDTLKEQVQKLKEQNKELKKQIQRTKKQ